MATNPLALSPYVRATDAEVVIWTRASSWPITLMGRRRFSSTEWATSTRLSPNSSVAVWSWMGVSASPTDRALRCAPPVGSASPSTS